MKQNLKISYQTFGENNAYLLEGSIKQINHFFNSIYNWEGTNGKLHDMGNGKAFYFYAHPEDVKKALVKVALHAFVNKINAKGRKGGLLDLATDKAQSIIDEMAQTCFLWGATSSEGYSLGTISAEKPSDYCGAISNGRD
jgi:hypothetical protein